jgi:hypothetical protein
MLEYYHISTTSCGCTLRGTRIIVSYLGTSPELFGLLTYPRRVQEVFPSPDRSPGEMGLKKSGTIGKMYLCKQIYTS